MFRPRFRLSLLFVLVAVVAGVSVWLRQAMVRDRNIRQLLAEEWVRGTPYDGENSLNTKILNWFTKDEPYYDGIIGIQFNFFQIKSTAALLEYKNLDLGSSSVWMLISSWDVEDSTDYSTTPFSQLPRKPVRLSQLLLFLENFTNISMLDSESVTFIDDVENFPLLERDCDNFRISHCNVDSLALQKLLGVLRTKPENVEIYSNRIRGCLKDFEEMKMFSKDKIMEFEKLNIFSEKRE